MDWTWIARESGLGNNRLREGPVKGLLPFPFKMNTFIFFSFCLDAKRKKQRKKSRAESPELKLLAFICSSQDERFATLMGVSHDDKTSIIS